MSSSDRECVDFDTKQCIVAILKSRDGRNKRNMYIARGVDLFLRLLLSVTTVVAGGSNCC